MANPVIPHVNLLLRREHDPRALTNYLILKGQALRGYALSHLTNLRSLEFTQRTLQVGISIPNAENVREETHEDTPWHTVHCNNIENLLRVIIWYYRMFYSYPDLRVLFENLLEEEIEDPLEAVDPIDDLPNEAIETVWNLDHQPASLDILAMEQLSADYLVDFFYHDFQFSCDPFGFA